MANRHCSLSEPTKLNPEILLPSMAPGDDPYTECDFTLHEAIEQLCLRTRALMDLMCAARLSVLTEQDIQRLCDTAYEDLSAAAALADILIVRERIRSKFEKAGAQGAGDIERYRQALRRIAEHKD